MANAGVEGGALFGPDAFVGGVDHVFTGFDLVGVVGGGDFLVTKSIKERASPRGSFFVAIDGPLCVDAIIHGGESSAGRFFTWSVCHTGCGPNVSVATAGAFFRGEIDFVGARLPGDFAAPKAGIEGGGAFREAFLSGDAFDSFAMISIRDAGLILPLVEGEVKVDGTSCGGGGSLKLGWIPGDFGSLFHGLAGFTTFAW